MSEAKRLSDDRLAVMARWNNARLKFGTKDIDELLGHIAALAAELAACRAENLRLRDALHQIIAASETYVAGNGSYYEGESDGLKTAAYIASQALLQEEKP